MVVWSGGGGVSLFDEFGCWFRFVGVWFRDVGVGGWGWFSVGFGSCIGYWGMSVELGFFVGGVRVGWISWL